MHQARSAAASKGEAGPDPTPLLGRKLSILYEIEGDSEHPYSEAVGMLQSVEGSGDASILIIRKRDASIVEVPASAIVKLKVVPSVDR